MLTELSITQQAIKKYEEDMFSCASDIHVHKKYRDLEMMAADSQMVKMSLDD